MEDKNINNSQNSAEKDKTKPKQTINLTVQEFVILGLCLVLTAVIVACNCIYSIPVATVQTTYAASSINTQTNAIETVAAAIGEDYSEESSDEAFTSKISTQTSNTGSTVIKEITKPTDSQQSSVVKIESSSSASESTGLVNINTADVTALCTLNGIGETKAEAIIVYRDTYGAFTSVEELNEVKGIGDATFNKIKDYVTIK